jgi:diaminohydroxyphosphoribosylaminopyrimidine deaminase/5-amino-6-(5-phosphoribosylamino)uracil reductase
LRSAGVEVESGVCASEARRQNAPYLKLLATGRPYVHAKWAMTLDGKLATRTGDSRWISGEASRGRVHALRGRMDAIIVGIGTVLADDPLLTVRPPGPRTPTRIVLDTRARLPMKSQLVRTADVAPVLVAALNPVPEEATRRLEESGCAILELPARDGRPDIVSLLEELGRRRMTNVLVEGGSAVLGSFLDAGAVDEVHVFLAPRLAGGSDAPTPGLPGRPVAGRGVERIKEALSLAAWEVQHVDQDLYVHGWR